MAQQTLDATGLTCPLPVLRARKALKQMAGGDELRVLATDPGAVNDFHAFCDAAGHRLVDWHCQDEVLTFIIAKAG